MAGFVISYDLLFFWRNNSIFPLSAGDNGLYALLQILLPNRLAALAYRTQSTFVDDVCQLGAGGTWRGPGQ